MGIVIEEQKPARFRARVCVCVQIMVLKLAPDLFDRISLKFQMEVWTSMALISDKSDLNQRSWSLSILGFEWNGIFYVWVDHLVCFVLPDLLLVIDPFLFYVKYLSPLT